MHTNAQSSALQRWGIWCAANARWVVLGWGVVLIASALLFPRFAESLGGSSLAVTGSESARTEQVLEEDFDGGVTEDAIIVIASESLTVRDSEFQRAISEAARTADDEPGVRSISVPQDSSSGEQVSEDGRTALVLVGLTGDERDRQELAPRLQSALDAVHVDDVSVSLTGSSALNAAVVEQQDTDIARAESIGLPVALVVLFVAFGTLVAAGLPLLLGVLTVVTAFGALGALSFATSFDVFVQAVVTMLGLALGIDYCLFIVTRFREELAREGPPNVPEAVGRTLATAGSAVLFSGSTVLISVSGLFLVQAPVFRSMALGVMVAVVVMLALSTTLLPALLGVLGRRIDRLKVPGLARSTAPVDIRKSWWARWTKAVLRRPVVIGGVTGVVLVLAAVPASDLKLGFDVGADAVSESPAGIGYAAVAEDFSPGAAAPLQVVIESKEPLAAQDLERVDEYTRELSYLPGVDEVESLSSALAAVGMPLEGASLEALQDSDSPGVDRLLSADRRATLTLVFADTAPDADETIALVESIRSLPEPEGLEVSVGGLSAQIVDVIAEVDRSTPWVVTVILGSSFVLLLLAFRSVVLALGAIIMNGLSVAAAFGLLTLVFQAGLGESVLDFTSRGFIQAYLPLFAFVVVFGLSMDYEVFLISRMIEEWDRGHDTRGAVVSGVAHSAKVITAAAGIMVVVFAAFMITQVTEVKQLGFALAVAVLVDATLIRLVMVPAVMGVLGRANWWLPDWLSRLLPGSGLSESAPAGCLTTPPRRR